MDAINPLPVKTLDRATPRPRSDASADQHNPGFSFANLLDEKNLSANEPAVAENAPMDGGDGEAESGELLAEVAPTSETAELSTLLAMFSTMPCLPTLPIVATPVGNTSLGYEASTECQDTGSDVTPVIPGAGSSISSETTDTVVPRADQSRFDPRPQETQSAIAGDRRGIRSIPNSPVIPPVARAVNALSGDIAEPVTKISPPGDEEVTSVPATLPIPAQTQQIFARIAPAPLSPPDPILREQDCQSSEDPLRSTPAQPRLAELKALPVNSESLLRMLEDTGHFINFTPLIATDESGEPKGAPIIPLDGVGPTVISSGNSPQLSENVIQANQLPATIAASTFASTSKFALDALETAPADFQSPHAESPLPNVRTVQQPIVQTRFRPADTIVAPAFDGTVTAMQEVAMPDPVKPHAPETKTVTLAGNSPTPQSTISMTDGRADIPVTALHRSPGLGTHQGDEGAAFQKQPDAIFPSIPTLNGTFAPPAAEAPLAPPVVRAEVETVIHRTMEAAERLRATGGERLEVQIRLDAGHELTVRLHLLQGEVKPVFVTESQELRRAIEQNWAQFTDRSSDKSTRVTTPVFESPNSQSGMNDLNQRQREGRERAFSQAQDEFFAGPNLPGRNPFRGPNAKPATVGLPSGVQLYA
ncbi:MAG: hypothetical protein K8R23_20140 [Chthoniobacter sp.]|nr:hypothetical protein [Chthoniobacter sp.]